MNNQPINILKDGGVGVLLTDTLYGLVGQALNKKTVERIYKIKNRNSKKPLIILISKTEDLKKFGIKINSKTQNILKNYWPGPTSIILSCESKKYKYLHRGTKTLGFRMPQKTSLAKIIEITGPLVAPSANPEDLPPAQNIMEAKKYFGVTVDFYQKGGKPKDKPSLVIRLNKDKIEVIRK